MNIQNFLHLERERQGLSKKEIAERAGCSDTAISFWELGKRRIGFSYAESILNALGYYAMFEYLNGFRKAIYWSKKKMEKHADRYSKAFNLSVYEKINTGVIPAKDLWKYSSFWYKDFDGMAHKTMLRQLISKWGIMSIEMQTAFEKDMTVIDEEGNAEYVDNIEYEADSDYIEMMETEVIQEAAMTEHEESDDAQMTILPNNAEDEVFSEDDFFNTEV